MTKYIKLQEIANKYYIRCLTKEEFGKILELFESKLTIDDWDIYKQETWYNGHTGVHDSFLRCEKGIDEILAKDVIKEFENNWLIEDGETISQNVIKKEFEKIDKEILNNNKNLENILGKNSNIHVNKTFPKILERPTQEEKLEKIIDEGLEKVSNKIKDSFQKTKEEFLSSIEKETPTLEKWGDNQKFTKEELEHELGKVLKKDITCEKNCSTVCGECQISPNDVPIGEEYIEYVHHPNHYGGENNVYEAIKIIEAHNLNFVEGNVVKYLLRYKKKNGFEDLEKALWYLNRLVENYKKNN